MSAIFTVQVFFNVLCAANCVVDLAFLLDTSESIRNNDEPGGNNWWVMIDFVNSIINEFTIAPDQTRVAVVDFGELALRDTPNFL